MSNSATKQFKNVIPVASGKGGVGKSTISANIAVALAKSGAKVGLMDADVYGPSIPTILGIKEPAKVEDDKIIPVEIHGVKVVSMGFFIKPNEAVIWRGPMLHKMVNDFLGAVKWGELDYLIVDLPPGTGDIQLSLCQTIAITGAVIVSTPQDVAWKVAQKAIVMFDKLNTPVLGVIENMNQFTCSHCGTSEEIFGNGGAKEATKLLGIPYLGSVPLTTSLRVASDKGESLLDSDPKNPAAVEMIKIAKNLVAEANNSDTQAQKLSVKTVTSPAPGKIEIEWGDGHKNIYSAKELRTACPCAVCVNEVTGERVVRSENIPDDIQALQFGIIGRYAIQIQWSDQHSTGIYAFQYLRNLAELSAHASG